MVSTSLSSISVIHSSVSSNLALITSSAYFLFSLLYSSAVCFFFVFSNYLLNISLCSCILLLNSLNILMIITLNSLSGRLVSSSGVSLFLNWGPFLLLPLSASFSFCFYVLTMSLVFLGLVEVETSLWRRRSVGPVAHPSTQPSLVPEWCPLQVAWAPLRGWLPWAQLDARPCLTHRLPATGGHSQVPEQLSEQPRGV